MKLTVREYVSANGRSYFREWLDSLAVPVRARIQTRIIRFETGNLGDHKSIGEGVWEARIMFGSGYRIYFGKEGRSIILLLLGGDKWSQARDIRKAQRLWKEYLEDKKHGTTHERLERGIAEAFYGVIPRANAASAKQLLDPKLTDVIHHFRSRFGLATYDATVFDQE